MKALLLDADGVIQRVPPDWSDGVAKLLGAAETDKDSCLAEIFAAESAAMTGAADFTQTVAPILSKWNSTDADFREAWHRIEVAGSVPELIAELRHRGIYCALASNQERHRARHMSEMLGYRHLFDREFYSCEIGHAKPSVDYFHRIVELAQLDPAQTLFLDDRVDNVEAARQAGIVAEHFVLQEMHGGARQLRTVLKKHGILR